MFYCSILSKLENLLSFNVFWYRTDGGISNNDFVMQLIADLTEKSIIRMPSPDRSAIGVALMAGMEQGIVDNNLIMNN